MLPKLHNKLWFLTTYYVSGSDIVKYILLIFFYKIKALVVVELNQTHKDELNF